MTDAAPARPVSVLIAAMGGEGGGVLTAWLVAAASKAGLPVQSTSIPGLAQRTGATTYYVEIWPAPLSPEGDGDPIFALYPTPGDIDVMVASELLEAGRAIEAGYVSPDRTVLVASTHRVFAIAEKTAMADGRFDERRVVDAARQLARRSVLVDLAAAARASGSAVNAVMLGAVAGAGLLPIPQAAFRDAIRAEGKAVDANIGGFDAGLALVAGGTEEIEASGEPMRRAPPTGRERLLRRARSFEPRSLSEVVVEGVNRLVDYQDARYARTYLDRVEAVLALDRSDDHEVTRETARYLALQMSYEDVIRVAQLKTRPERMSRLRAEIGAAHGEPVRISEFLKPGIEELCAILPGFIARPMLGWASRRRLTDRLHVGLRLNSASIGGFLLLKTLAALRPLRRISHRFVEDRRRLEHWLSLVREAAARDPDFAVEVARSARLIKGYGDTFRRGLGNYGRIVSEIVEPALARGEVPATVGETIDAACTAALADPTGAALDRAMAGGSR